MSSNTGYLTVVPPEQPSWTSYGGQKWQCPRKQLTATVPTSSWNSYQPLLVEKRRKSKKCHTENCQLFFKMAPNRKKKKAVTNKQHVRSQRGHRELKVS
jgi:hypothetical protein